MGISGQNSVEIRDAGLTSAIAITGAVNGDTLLGSEGNDTFVVDTPIDGSPNIDRIIDFTRGADRIEIDHAFYLPGLTPGELDAAQFAVGAATQAGPQIVYNTSTGALYYDSNGTGAGGFTQFAVLTGAPTLTNHDFWIV